MGAGMSEGQQVYLGMVTEAVHRLQAVEAFLAAHRKCSALATADAAVLQTRKALEAIAFASVAPHRAEYERLRASSDENSDYTKDYHAKRIFRALSKVNKDFFPLPLMPPEPDPVGVLHFGRRSSGFIDKQRFGTVYDRLGKHLHARNPWSNTGGYDALIQELPQVVEETFGLVELHSAIIRSPSFSGVWVVQAPRDGSPAHLFVGEAHGEFVVNES